jgi:hypothetical protein
VLASFHKKSDTGAARLILKDCAHSFVSGVGGQLWKIAPSAGTYTGQGSPPILLFPHLPLTRFDLMWVGCLSFGLAPSSDVSDTQSNSHDILISYAHELCSFCCALPKRFPIQWERLVQSGSPIDQTLLSREFGPECLWSIVDWGVVFYLFLLSTHSRSKSETEILVKKVERKLAAECTGPTSSIVPVLWALITDFETLSLESIPRMQNLTRFVFVMDKLTADVQWILQKFLFRRLAPALESHIDTSNPGRKVDPSTAEDNIELATLQAAIWGNISQQLSSEFLKAGGYIQEISSRTATPLWSLHKRTD